jgi:amino-acid N-acetyltransferase
VSPLIRSATAADLEAIRALLEQNALPASDLGSSRPQFLVACADGGARVGAGALEPHGTTALLRSLVVAPSWRGRGLGHRLVKALERQARAAGIRELVLLTQTAEAFFAQLGYGVIERARAPEAVQESSEFRTLCPASAVCMRKTLRE